MTMTKIPSTEACHTYGHGCLKVLFHIFFSIIVNPRLP